MYDADPSKRIAICDGQDRPRWHPLWDGNPILATPTDVARGESVTRIRNASGCRPYIQYPFTVETGWTFTDWRARDHRGRLYLHSSDELAGAKVRQHGRFVLIEPSPKPAQPNRQWSLDAYRALVARHRDLRFVQPIHEATRSRLPGIEHVPTHGFRETCGLLRAARLYLGPEGGLAHAAAALGVQAVVIFGGCISVETMGYPEHRNLVAETPGTPCGRYQPCPHCVVAMQSLTVEQVSHALTDVLERQERAA